jgi:hypothetical protein
MLLFYSKYMLFTGREGRTGKIFSVDLRFRAASEDEGKDLFQYGPT